MTGTSTIRSRRPVTERPRPARRTGYLISILLNVAGLFLINVAPGWHAVPFLSDNTAQVLGIVNAMLIATVAVNLVYMFVDPRWLVALGGLGTTVLGVIGLVQIWAVFPFDFGDSSVDWPLLFRIALVIGIAGCGVAILVQIGQLTAALARLRQRRPSRRI